MELVYDLTSFSCLRWSSGKEAGYFVSDGYISVEVGGKSLPSHRIIWEMFNGKIPDGLVVDHIDGDRTNNRIENLRVCTRAENSRNCKKSKANTSGFKGVSRSGNKWRAQIRVNRKRISLGNFLTKEEAHKAYCDAAEYYFKEFARTE